MKIGIGNDHVAVQMKQEITVYLESKGYIVVNFGCDSFEICDYPIYGKKVAKAIISSEIDCGILICGTGIGISLAANKVYGIRAAVCSEPYSAQLAKMHNNANIIAFGSKVVGIEMAKLIVDNWLEAKFEGKIHQKRIDMMMKMESEKERNIT